MRIYFENPNGGYCELFCELPQENDYPSPGFMEAIEAIAAERGMTVTESCSGIRS